jgi:serine/threonine protein kinase
MSAASSPPNPDLPIQVGDVLAGKYRVEQVLGVGGMGIVVQARHLDLDEKVALKFLLPQAMQSQEATERFIREAKAAVRLRSEHVARVRDVGKLDNGSPYMVMEFLDGADLSRVVQTAGSLTVEESVAFVLQACEAIAEAHSLGIIHRDLKPQNLFVTRRVDGRPLVKVLDFGISKSIDAQGGGLSLTRTSSIMGSPLYMSPEQMRSSKNVDQRSDIWGLGVILYELLTGRVPFEAEAIPELCLKVVQDPAEPPKSIRPEISEGLNAVVLKCLEKEPSRRFENVADLAAALEPYSESSKGSSDRIAAVLNVPSRPPMVSISAISSTSNPKIGTGGTAWGTTQQVQQRRMRIPLIAGGVGAAVLLAIGVAVAMHGSKDQHAAAADSAALSSAPTPPSPPAATEAPKPVQTTEAPQATATAAPAETAAPAPAHKVTTKPSGASKPTSSPKPASSTKPTAAPALTAPPRQFGE